MTEWRPVRYKGLSLPYEVSDDGKVRRVASKDCAGRARPQHEMIPHAVGQGYMQVILHSNRRRFSPLVHTLVAFAFLGPPPVRYRRGKLGLNHLDGDKANNRPDNLEWASPLANKAHARLNGFIARGEKINTARLTEDDVRNVRQRYHAGESMASLAREFGISDTGMGYICKRVNWRHII
jgi:hypothetical protein